MIGLLLNYNTWVPLHIQLKEQIEKRIIEGHYKDRIPSERELIEEYRISRSTVREAIGQLVREGILERRPGKGTFVIKKSIEDWLGNLSSTAETIQNMNMRPGTRLIDCEIIELNDYLKSVTGLKEAFYFKRVRYANDIPLGIERSYYPTDLGIKLSKYDLNKESFYDLLENKLGVQTLEAIEIIKARKISKEDAALLNIPLGSVIIIAERKITDINGNFVEFEDACYRADMYSFKIKLSRKKY